ncbi:MAG: filamentous hemagglutinin N-terminal domain-containing protein [Cyanobacteria bacterium J06633_8]
MKGIAFLPGFISAVITLGIIVPVNSQVTSDGTTNTTVNSTGNNFNILNGIQKGTNLFHSFKEFSIPTGSSATFQNSSAIENIINRVTGGNVSNIDGLIKANGSASVFFINPSGIVFGENARLDIGGSFLGTTAESILFEDGFEFSAVNAQSEPLLTISVPLGLQMGSNPGAIAIQGNGHNLRGGSSRALTGSKGVSQINVNPGKTLALIGGMVTLDGGVITGEGANIEVGSVGSQNQNGTVGLKFTNTGWTFNYTEINNFASVNLKQRALVDASGINAGKIQLTGKNIEITDGSLVLIDNQGTGTSGSIIANASENLKVIGSTPNLTVDSRLTAYTTNSGKSGDIFVSAKQLILEQGGDLLSSTFSEGQGGNINIDVSDVISVGDADVNSQSSNRITSLISTRTFSSGKGGNLIISTKQLNIFPRAGIITGTSGNIASAGNIIINATESLEMLGVPESPNGLLISSSSLGEGTAGEVEINTPKLKLFYGAAIGASNFGAGSGGKITVNASESIELNGTRPDLSLGTVPSQIAASSRSATPGSQAFFGLEPIPRGNSGSVILNSPLISVQNGAEIAVRNEGLGDGGTLVINAERLFLSNQGQLQGISNSGTGGDISLKTENLLLRNGSTINTTAGGTGNGGNITINSPIIAGFENSDIIANAVEGNGGNINITTSGIFGLEFSDRLTPNSDITASSQLGVNGTVEINNVGIDPSSGLIELPTELTDPSQQIASRCSSNNESSFVATGRGGMPQNPTESVDLNPTWSDIRDLSEFRQRNNNTVENPRISNQPAIVEATGFIRNENGEIELVALENNPLKNKQVAECSGKNT